MGPVPANADAAKPIVKRQPPRGTSVPLSDFVTIPKIAKKSIYTQLLTFLRSIIHSKIDSPNGVPIHTDAPLNNPPLINLERPAPVRIHYGLNLESDPSGLIRRVTYGLGSGATSVGTDYRHFQTRSLTPQLSSAAGDIYRLLSSLPRQNSSKRNNHGNIKPFNHCTVLFYRNGKLLGHHCDSVYDKRGVWLKKDNSQTRNTPVAIYTLGKTRILEMVAQQVCGKKWVNSISHPTTTFEMKNASLFILHPDDEKPIKRSEGRNGYVRFKHGVKKVQGEGLSVGFVFRSVAESEWYNKTTNKKELTKSEIDWLKLPFGSQNISRGDFHDRVREEYIDSNSPEEQHATLISLLNSYF
jgi:hypothetical protein